MEFDERGVFLNLSSLAKKKGLHVQYHHISKYDTSLISINTSLGACIATVKVATKINDSSVYMAFADKYLLSGTLSKNSLCAILCTASESKISSIEGLGTYSFSLQLGPGNWAKLDQACSELMNHLKYFREDIKGKISNEARDADKEHAMFSPVIEVGNKKIACPAFNLTPLSIEYVCPKKLGLKNLKEIIGMHEVYGFPIKLKNYYSCSKSLSGLFFNLKKDKLII